MNEYNRSWRKMHTKFGCYWVREYSNCMIRIKEIPMDKKITKYAVDLSEFQKEPKVFDDLQTAIFWVEKGGVL